MSQKVQFPDDQPIGNGTDSSNNIVDRAVESANAVQAPRTAKLLEGSGEATPAAPRVVAAAVPPVLEIRREGHRNRLVRSKNVFSFDAADVAARVRPISGRVPTSPGPLAVVAVEELVECAVCGQRLRMPRMLPCQHTFCAACLVERLHTSKGRSYAVLRCAVCALELQLPLVLDAPGDMQAAAVAALPRNLYLESLLRLLEASSTFAPSTPAPSTSDVEGPRPHQAHQQEDQCARCQTIGIAISRCQHCRQSLCDVCWPSHLSELETQLSVLAAQLDDAAKRLRLRTRDYEERCEAAGARATAAAEARRAAVRRDEERAAAEVVALKERASADADRLHAELRAARDTLRLPGSTDDRPGFDPLADNTHKVAEFIRAHGATAALLARVARWGDARPSFDADAFRVELLAPDAPQAASALVTSATGNEDDVAPPETHDVDDVSLNYRVNAWTPRLTVRRSALRRPAGAALAPWASELFVAAADAHAVLVVEWGTGRLLRRLAAPEMLCPQAVAFSHARQEVYVTDKFNHCVHVFERGGAFARTMGRKGAAAGQLRSPEGLAAVADSNGEELLYVCDTGNDRVQVLRADTGKPVYQLGRDVVHLNQPTGVALCPSLDLIAIADCGNNRIKVVSLSTGELRRELGNRGSRRGQFRAPEAVALDPQGFLVVADTGNSRLQVFRTKGDWRLVRLLGAGCLQWPSGLHVTPCRDLVVADASAHAVYIL